MTGTIKPNHKALAAYYETLRAYGEQQVTHEGALETAFQRLLADTAGARGWMLHTAFEFERQRRKLLFEYELGLRPTRRAKLNVELPVGDVRDAPRACSEFGRQLGY